MNEATANMNAPALLACPNMIAIASGKGGVGKTWLAATLCHALAKSGARVLLFDGDLGLANVDIQLGLTPEKDLGAVIEDRMPLAGAVTPFREGDFDIVAGRSGSGNLASLPAQRVAELRNDLIKLAAAYDKVVVDLGAGIDRAVRVMAGPAARVLVIVTDEPTSLTDAYAFIKVTVKANPAAAPCVVVNMAANAADGHKTYETIQTVCRKFLDYDPPLWGVVRRDARVRDAIRAQTSLLTRYPGCAAAADIEALANRILE